MSGDFFVGGLTAILVVMWIASFTYPEFGAFITVPEPAYVVSR